MAQEPDISPAAPPSRPIDDALASDSPVLAGSPAGLGRTAEFPRIASQPSSCLLARLRPAGSSWSAVRASEPNAMERVRWSHGVARPSLPPRLPRPPTRRASMMRVKLGATSQHASQQLTRPLGSEACGAGWVEAPRRHGGAAGMSSCQPSPASCTQKTNCGYPRSRTLAKPFLAQNAFARIISQLAEA